MLPTDQPWLGSSLVKCRTSRLQFTGSLPTPSSNLPRASMGPVVAPGKSGIRNHTQKSYVLLGGCNTATALPGKRWGVVRLHRSEQAEILGAHAAFSLAAWGVSYMPAPRSRRIAQGTMHFVYLTTGDQERCLCPCPGWQLQRLLGHIPGACIRACGRACEGAFVPTPVVMSASHRRSFLARICLQNYVAYHHEAGGRVALPCASRWLPYPLPLLCLLVRLDLETFTSIRASAQVCTRLRRSYPWL